MVTRFLLAGWQLSSAALWATQAECLRSRWSLCTRRAAGSRGKVGRSDRAGQPAHSCLKVRALAPAGVRAEAALGTRNGSPNGSTVYWQKT